MSKSTIGKLLIGLVLTGFIYLHYVVIYRVLKQPDSLTEANGIITNIQKIKIPKRYAGNNYAYALTIQDNPLRFAVHEKNQRAYDYIGFNDVKGNRIKLLYDPIGFNSKENLTYHIYFIEINGQQILNINESKQTDKIGLAIFFAFDLLILIMIFYIRKQKNN
jgi:hypothetical protein